MRAPALLVLLVACGTDDPAPTVTVMSATPDALRPTDDAADDLTITVRYADADGDLGTGVADVFDCRAADLVTSLIIPAIAPDGIAGKEHISGTLELFVNDVGDVASGALPDVGADLGVAALGANEAVFCVELEDAKGNRGIGDCTGVILLE